MPHKKGQKQFYYLSVWSSSGSVGQRDGPFLWQHEDADAVRIVGRATSEHHSTGVSTRHLHLFQKIAVRRNCKSAWLNTRHLCRNVEAISALQTSKISSASKRSQQLVVVFCFARAWGTKEKWKGKKLDGAKAKWGLAFIKEKTLKLCFHQEHLNEKPPSLIGSKKKKKSQRMT